MKIDKFIAKLSYILIFLLLCGCYNGEDIIGKVKIQYDGEWNAVIAEKYESSDHNGIGDRFYEFRNPDYLKVTANKLDSTDGKITVYIYEYERIVKGSSTRDPEGTVTAEYEYPF